MGLKERFGSIKEALVSAMSSGSTWVSTSIESLWGIREKAPINREDYMKLYEDNFLAKSAIDTTVSDAFGSGYFTSIKKEVRGKEIVDDFAELVDQDTINLLVVRDMLVVGDGIVERIWDKEGKITVTEGGKQKEVLGPLDGAKLIGLKWAPSYTFEVERTPEGKILWWVQKVGMSERFFHSNKIINFKWNPTGTSPYGTSEMKPVYDLLKDLDKIRENFVAITKRYAKPPIIWKGKGISQGQMDAHKNTVETKGPDQDIYLNTDLIEAEVLEIDPRGKFENYYQQFINAATIGLGTPSLPSLEQATLASSRTMVEFYEKKIHRIRKLVARVIEKEVFKILIEQAGFKEIPRVRFPAFTAQFRGASPEFVLELLKAQLYTQDQAKLVLERMGFPFPSVEKQEE